MSNTGPVRLLLIADNPADADRLRALLPAAPRLACQLAHVDRLAAAAPLIGPEHADLVLLALSRLSPDGLAILAQARTLAHPLPVVVLTELDDEGAALAAIEQGAQDVLVKGKVDGPGLERAILHAIARRRAEEKERQLIQERAASAAAKEEESRFRGLAEAIPQLVWEYNSAGRFDFMSSRWYEYTGQAPGQGSAEQFSAALHPDDAGPLLSQWQAAVQTATNWQSEYRLRRADGTYRWHLGRAVPVLDKDGVSIKWYGTATDIDDHKNNEHERLRLYDQAQQAIKSRDELLATVSHDLRNPLSTIAMVASLMLVAPAHDEASKRLRRHAEKLDRAVKRMEHLIRDLQDLASIENGHLSLSPNPTPLVTILTDAIEAHSQAAQAKGIKLQGDTTDCGIWVACDRERILQVLANLVGNAIKFTPEGGTVELRYFRRPSDVCLSVADTGPGIAAEDKPRVFERFWQGKSIARTGSGLGLAISKGIMDRHGGELWVESELGRGATFSFTLPLATLPG